MKKFLSGLLTLALLVGTIPVTNLIASEPTQEPAKFTGFDENNIAYRFAVLSDVHMAYDNYEEGAIASTTRKYAAAVAQLAKLSEGDLDAVMFTGDYTGTGSVATRESFAQVTETLFTGGAYTNGNSIFNKTPAIILAYGNHETEMSIEGSHEYDTTVEELESTFKSEDYPVFKNMFEGGTCYKGTDGLGSYWMKVGNYNFITVEIEGYNIWDSSLGESGRGSNYYNAETLKWLQTTLQTITTDENYNNEYIYIGTHAPVENTIYDSQQEFFDSADWGSTKRDKAVTDENGMEYNFHNILSQYPQVIVFSGHTHAAPELETSIMSDTYTSIGAGSTTDPSVLAGTAYLDSSKSNANNGYGIYIEVDNAGNQRIKRISFENTDAVTITNTDYTYESVLYTYKDGSGKTTNTPKLTLNNWVSNLTDGFTPVYAGEDWQLPAVSAENKTAHLNYYSKENRNQKVTPVFNTGDIKVEDFVADKKGASMKLTFPTATTTAVDTSIVYYTIDFCDADTNEVLHSVRAAGNWYPGESGGVTAAQRATATSLTYTIDNIQGAVNLDQYGEAASKNPIYVSITAKDEYGNVSQVKKSTVLEADATLSEISFSTTGNPNLLSTMAAVHSSLNNSVDSLLPINSITLKGINDEGQAQEPHVNFYLDREKYNQLLNNYDTTALGGLVINSANILPYMSDFSSGESVVYEMDVKCTQVTDAAGGFSIKFRVANNSDSYALQLNVRNNGLSIFKQYLGGISGWGSTTVYSSTSAKLNVVNDNTTQHITMLATPKEVSVWVDGSLVINKFDISSNVVENMYPVFSIEHRGANVELSNMRVYRYDSTTVIKQTEPTKTIAQKNYTDADTLTIRSNYSSYVNKTGEAFYTDNSNGGMWISPNWAAAKDAPQYVNMFLSQSGYQALMEKANKEQAQWADYWPREGRPSTEFAKYMSDFKETDTVVYDYRYYTNALYTEGNLGYKFDFRVRGTGTKTEGVTVSIRTDGLYIGVAGTYLKVDDSITLATGGSWHKVTIVASPERLSLWHDGTQIVDNLLYTKVNSNAPEVTYPIATYVVTNVGMIIQETKVYNYDETAWDSVRADDSCVTNISNTFTSNLRNVKVFGFDNIINIKMANNYNPNKDGSHYWWTTYVDPIGSDTFDTADSYVLSARISLVPDAAAGTTRRQIVFGTTEIVDKSANDYKILAIPLFGTDNAQLQYIHSKKQHEDTTTIASSTDASVKYNTTDNNIDVLDIKAIVSKTHITVSVNGVLLADNLELEKPLEEIYPEFIVGGYNMSISDVHVYYNNSYYEQAAETALEGKLAAQESYTNATWKAYQDAVNTLTEAAELSCDKTTRNQIKLAISDYSGTDGALRKAVRGDVNGDDCIDVRDIVRYKKYLKDSSTDIRPTGADIKVDTSYNKDDLDKLRDMLLRVTEE